MGAWAKNIYLKLAPNTAIGAFKQSTWFAPMNC